MQAPKDSLSAESMTEIPMTVTDESETCAQQRQSAAEKILEWAGKCSGIDADIEKACGSDGDLALKVTSLARYTLLSGGAPLDSVSSFLMTHTLPSRGPLGPEECVQTLSDLGKRAKFREITSKLFRARAERLTDESVCAFDLKIPPACTGYRSRQVPFQPLRLVVLCGTESNQPAAFALRVSNIIDEPAVEWALQSLSYLGLRVFTTVSESAGDTERGIEYLCSHRMRFLAAAPDERGWVDGCHFEAESRFKAVTPDPLVWHEGCDRGLRIPVIQDLTEGTSLEGKGKAHARRLSVFVLSAGDRAALEQKSEEMYLEDLAVTKTRMGDWWDGNLSGISFSRRSDSDGDPDLRYEARSTMEPFIPGLITLVSNTRLTEGGALSLYRRRCAWAESFASGLEPQGRDARSFSSDVQRGRLLVVFASLCCRCFIEERLKELSSSLQSESSEPEQEAGRWLSEQTPESFLRWFDAREEVQADTPESRERWSEKSRSRSALILSRLGTLQAHSLVPSLK